jgi:hypothetical protein
MNNYRRYTMIRTESLSINGHDLVRTYSDAGKKVIRVGTGIEYDEAIDPVEMGRTYTESENDIEVFEEEEWT